MNIYGDMGNIKTLEKRAHWRGIETEYITLDENSNITDGDIFFMGGGQDNDMYSVFEDMLTQKKSKVSELVAQNKVFLLVCGGYQLFGDYFLDAQGREIEGLGILPISTKSQGGKLSNRCLGDLVVKINPAILVLIRKYYAEIFSDYFVGLENHSGQTYFNNKQIINLGDTIVGSGNNISEKKEGAKFKNVFGTYSHGSLLPKNPHMADMLIGQALQNKYKDEKISLSKLDDSVEILAHNAILKRYNINSH